MKSDSIAVKPNVKREVLQEELVFFFTSLQQLTVSKSKSEANKRSIRYTDKIIEAIEG